MLSFCANPECTEEFRYAGRGKIVVVERQERGGDGNANRRRELFWLCPECALRFQLMVDGDAVKCMPRGS